MLILPETLRSEALQFFIEKIEGKKLPFGKSCELLSKHFHHNENLDKIELSNLSRVHEESFLGFSKRVRKVVDGAYPKFNEDAKDVLVIEKFLDGVARSLEYYF